MIKYWIFDFDGVLARSIEDEIDLEINHMKSTLSRGEIKKRLEEYFSDTRHARKNNLTNQQKLDKVNYINEHGKYVMSVENEVFHEFIGYIKDIDNLKLAIASSASEQAIKHLLGDYMNMFDYIFGIQTSTSKEDKVNKLLKNWGVMSGQTKYFTDTLSDVIELEGLIGNKNIYGCVWGWCGKNILLKKLPESQILNKFSDIKHID